MKRRLSPEARYRLKGFVFGVLFWLVPFLPMSVSSNGAVNWERALRDVGISILVGLGLAAIATMPKE